MGSTMEASLLLFLIVVVALAAVVLLGPALRQAAVEAPAFSLPAAPAVPAVQPVVRPAIRSNWGELDLDVAGALGHAVTKHGHMAEEALAKAARGDCQPYLPCGASWSSLADGTKGYFLCQLSNGQTWLVPFLADALVLRLVAMTAYPIRAGYEPRVRVPGDCAPVELLPQIWGDGGLDDGDVER